MANRTLQFHGYAYGSVPVQLNAQINGEVVFSGAVSTQDQPLPMVAPEGTPIPVLFTVENSSLFPTEFSGSLPMTVSITTGEGVILSEVSSNYMVNIRDSFTPEFWSDNSTIVGDVLTIGTLTSGTVAVGQRLSGPDIPPRKIISGEGSVWTIGHPVVNKIGPTIIGGGVFVDLPGNATGFVSCYNGTPSNVEDTVDPRTSVTIDNVPQSPTRDGANGTWHWVVQTGSTLACDLHVGIGNVA
jgi:hypothetical protein